MTRSDVVFTFSVEMLDDAVQREFCRPPDQTLLALAADDQVGRLLVADSWRSLPVSLLRRTAGPTVGADHDRWPSGDPATAPPAPCRRIHQPQFG